MNQLILGPAGSGKTHRIIESILSDLLAEKRVFLLVPEQSAVVVETLVCEAAAKRGVPLYNSEILNFKRLCNRVAREHGGITYRPVSAGAKALLLFEAFLSTAPHLRFYRSEIENVTRFIPSLLSQIEEFKQYTVSPAQLEKASIEAREDYPHLADKLFDFSLLYAEYTRRLTDGRTDPSDDLGRLADILSRNDFFKNTHLYLDGFAGFTPQQYRVLSYAFRQAAQVTVSFCHDQNGSAAFENADKELRTLLFYFPKEYQTVRLDRTYRFRADELRYMERELFRVSEAIPYDEPSPAISTVLAVNPYDEAEFTASDIRRRLREEKAKYSDFAVIVRDVESYRGILDPILEKYRLPYYLTRKVSLSETPLFKFLLSALLVLTSDWSSEHILTFIKTGLAGIDSSAVHELEAYMTRWNLYGRRFYEENDWCMNPDGYTVRFTEEGRALLLRVNETRRRIVRPLRKLHESFDGTRTVKECCEALYAFLTDYEIPALLEERGNEDEKRLFNTLSDILDTLVDCMPERKVTASLFLGLFTLVNDQSRVGNLPATTDEIVIGSADRIRLGQVKHVYLLGANEGVFPAASHDDGLFSDVEKGYLETCSLVLSPPSDHDAINEYFRFYTSACVASNSLTVTCARRSLSGEKMNPSLPFTRIQLLFPNAAVIDTERLSPDFYLQSREAAFERLSSLPAGPLADGLAACFVNDPAYAFYFDADRQGLSFAEEPLNLTLADKLSKHDLTLSPTRLETFVKCPFSYQCTYALRLRENESAEFGANNTGSLIHHILEIFFQTVDIKNAKTQTMTEKEIDAIIKRITDEYFASVFGGDASHSLTKRLGQLMRRLRRTVKLLVMSLLEEFTQSEFSPRFFELPINTYDEGAVTPMRIPLPDGSGVRLTGTVDRVDVLKKGDDVYVRIVDYKTNGKKFSLSDVALGLNLQMLLYLFSIWRDEGNDFHRMLDAKGEIFPAGILYTRVNAGNVRAQADTDKEEVYALALKALTKNGMLLSDEEILRFMEAKLEGKYIPVTLKKDALHASGVKLQSLAEIGELFDRVCQTVSAIATEIKEGRADCRPLKTPTNDACRYCKHRVICRNPLSVTETSAF